MATVTETVPAQPELIRLHYLWPVGLALAVMIGAITSHNIWFLNWVHVMAGVLWTGTDLFMGFVLGPIIGGLDASARKQVLLRLTPKTLFLLPTLAVITGIAGWFPAVDLGLTSLPWPLIAWISGR